MIQQEANLFDKGLSLDTNEIAIDNHMLTGALNATMVTMNGNELVLQNDMGNAKVESAYLPSGYVPVGMKEYGGIVYVASYNPLLNKSLIGSFPSPERNISSDETEHLSCNINTLCNFITNGEIKNTVNQSCLISDVVRPGDSFIIETDESNITSLCNNYSNGLIDFKVMVKDSEGSYIDITDEMNSVCKGLNTNSINYLYPTVINDSNSDLYEKNYTIHKNKIAGLIFLQERLIIPDYIQVSISAETRTFNNSITYRIKFVPTPRELNTNTSWTELHPNINLTYQYNLVATCGTTTLINTDNQNYIDIFDIKNTSIKYTITPIISYESCTGSLTNLIKEGYVETSKLNSTFTEFNEFRYYNYDDHLRLEYNIESYINTNKYIIDSIQLLYIECPKPAVSITSATTLNQSTSNIISGNLIAGNDIGSNPEFKYIDLPETDYFGTYYHDIYFNNDFKKNNIYIGRLKVKLHNIDGVSDNSIDVDISGTTQTITPTSTIYVPARDLWGNPVYNDCPVYSYTYYSDDFYMIFTHKLLNTFYKNHPSDSMIKMYQHKSTETNTNKETIELDWDADWKVTNTITDDEEDKKVTSTTSEDFYNTPYLDGNQSSFPTSTSGNKLYQTYSKKSGTLTQEFNANIAVDNLTNFPLVSKISKTYSKTTPELQSNIEYESNGNYSELSGKLKYEDATVTSGTDDNINIINYKLYSNFISTLKSDIVSSESINIPAYVPYLYINESDDNNYHSLNEEIVGEYIYSKDSNNVETYVPYKYVYFRRNFYGLYKNKLIRIAKLDLNASEIYKNSYDCTYNYNGFFSQVSTWINDQYDDESVVFWVEPDDPELIEHPDNTFNYVYSVKPGYKTDKKTWEEKLKSAILMYSTGKNSIYLLNQYDTTGNILKHFIYDFNRIYVYQKDSNLNFKYYQANQNNYIYTKSNLLEITSTVDVTPSINVTNYSTIKYGNYILNVPDFILNENSKSNTNSYTENYTINSSDRTDLYLETINYEFNSSDINTGILYNDLLIFKSSIPDSIGNIIGTEDVKSNKIYYLDPNNHFIDCTTYDTSTYSNNQLGSLIAKACYDEKLLVEYSENEKNIFVVNPNNKYTTSMRIGLKYNTSGKISYGSDEYLHYFVDNLFLLNLPLITSIETM